MQTLIFNLTTRCWGERNYIVLFPFQQSEKAIFMNPPVIISLMYDCVVVRSNALGLSGMQCWSKWPYISDRVQRMRAWGWALRSQQGEAGRDLLCTPSIRSIWSGSWFQRWAASFSLQWRRLLFHLWAQTKPHAQSCIAGSCGSLNSRRQRDTSLPLSSP